MNKIRKILPYLLASCAVIGLWWFLTRRDNYAWDPKGKELLMLDVALVSIFYYKTLFWLVIVNLAVFTTLQLFRRNYKIAAIMTGVCLMIYMTVSPAVDRKCAFHYYSVFHNQSVAEEFIRDPIIDAGYDIGPFLTRDIPDKQMKYRRYAISGLESIKYKPATAALATILRDKSEAVEFRADALKALDVFDTDESRQVTSHFREQASDPESRKILDLTSRAGSQ
jgi:hypothetical protein